MSENVIGWRVLSHEAVDTTKVLFISYDRQEAQNFMLDQLGQYASLSLVPSFDHVDTSDSRQPSVLAGGSAEGTPVPEPSFRSVWRVVLFESSGTRKILARFDDQDKAKKFYLAHTYIPNIAMDYVFETEDSNPDLEQKSENFFFELNRELS